MKEPSLGYIRRYRSDSWNLGFWHVTEKRQCEVIVVLWDMDAGNGSAAVPATNALAHRWWAFDCEEEAKRGLDCHVTVVLVV